MKAVEDADPGDVLTLSIAHVEDDYSISTFTVKATLLEDKGNTAESTTQSESTTRFYFNPFQ